MTDGQSLFAVFTAFYLLECVRWLPVAAQVFRSWTSRRSWSLLQPLPYLAGRGVGPAITWPLPPLGGFMVTQSWPILPDEEGLCVAPGQLQRGSKVRWPDVSLSNDKEMVRLSADVTVRCISPRAAKALVKFIASVQSAKPDERQPLIDEFWLRSLSPPAARAAVRKYALAASVLRWPCICLFMLCFGWLPYVFWWFSGDALRLGSAMVAVLVLDVVVAWTWRRLDQRIFGDAISRWTQVLHLIVMPAHAIRALDLIGLDAVAPFHSGVVASVLLPESKARAVASAEWRNWKYRQASMLGPEVVAQVLVRLEACFRRLGYQVDELDAPPTQEYGSKRYCQCCHEQFVIDDARCQPCGDLETRAWPAMDSSAG